MKGSNLDLERTEEQGQGQDSERVRDVPVRAGHWQRTVSPGLPLTLSATQAQSECLEAGSDARSRGAEPRLLHSVCAPRTTTPAPPIPTVTHQELGPRHGHVHNTGATSLSGYPTMTASQPRHTQTPPCLPVSASAWNAVPCPRQPLLALLSHRDTSGHFSLSPSSCASYFTKLCHLPAPLKSPNSLLLQRSAAPSHRAPASLEACLL